MFHYSAVATNIFHLLSTYMLEECHVYVVNISKFVKPKILFTYILFVRKVSKMILE